MIVEVLLKKFTFMVTFLNFPGNSHYSSNISRSKYQKQKSLYIAKRSRIRARYNRTITKYSEYIKHFPLHTSRGLSQTFPTVLLTECQGQFLSEYSYNRLQNTMDREQIYATVSDQGNCA